MKFLTDNSKIPEPENHIQFIDVHCHVPYPKKKNTVPPEDKQYKQYFRDGGLFLITSPID